MYDILGNVQTCNTYFTLCMYDPHVTQPLYPPPPPYFVKTFQDEKTSNVVDISSAT